MHRETYFGGKYISRISFCFKGQQPSPPFIPQKPLFGEHLNKPLESVFAYILTIDDGNLRAKPPSWSRGRAHSGREPGREKGFAPTPPPKITFAYLSVNFACNFVQERSAKNQSACYIFTSSSPLPAWGQLRKSDIDQAVIVLRALLMIAATGETAHTSLKHGHVDYVICILHLQSVTIDHWRRWSRHAWLEWVCGRL